MRQALTNFILKAYTLSKGKALAGQKVAQQSVHPVTLLVRGGRLDAGDSAAFSSIFLASSFFCSQAESTPAPAPLKPTAGRRMRPKQKFTDQGFRWTR